MTNALTILLVDDNREDLEFYTDLLKRGQAEYQILTAHSSQEALDIVKSRPVDFALIDYYLPQINGMQLFELLRKESGGKNLPVVILTGTPNQAIQAEAARKGALDYIVKDLTHSSEQLEAVITKTLSWSKNLKNTSAASAPKSTT